MHTTMWLGMLAILTDKLRKRFWTKSLGRWCTTRGSGTTIKFYHSQRRHGQIIISLSSVGKAPRSECDRFCHFCPCECFCQRLHQDWRCPHGASSFINYHHHDHRYYHHVFVWEYFIKINTFCMVPDTLQDHYFSFDNNLLLRSRQHFISSVRRSFRDHAPRATDSPPKPFFLFYSAQRRSSAVHCSVATVALKCYDMIDGTQDNSRNNSTQ